MTDKATITTLAMSSVFTPPASCSQSWTYEPSGANMISKGLLLQNAVDDEGTDPDCFPSGYSQYERRRPTILYSPGWCPSGYTSADLVVHDPVTTAICCLSDFKYVTQDRANDITFAGCTSMLPSSNSTLVTVRDATAESTQVIGPVTMWAQPIQIQLEAKDSSLFITSSPTTTGATPSPADPSSSSTATRPTPTHTGTVTDVGNDLESGGLSTGASIGIGVGVGMASLIVIAGLAFWLFRRHQAKKRTQDPLNASYQSGNPEASELSGSLASPNHSYPHTAPSELGGSSGPTGSSIQGNSQTTRFSELQGSNHRPNSLHELGA